MVDIIVAGCSTPNQVPRYCVRTLKPSAYLRPLEQDALAPIYLLNDTDLENNNPSNFVFNCRLGH